MRELKFQLTRILPYEDRIADFENVPAKTRILAYFNQWTNMKWIKNILLWKFLTFHEFRCFWAFQSLKQKYEHLRHLSF